MAYGSNDKEFTSRRGFEGELRPSSVRNKQLSSNQVPDLWNFSYDDETLFVRMKPRATLQSDNFEPGEAGWRINGNGIAELDQVLIRGELGEIKIVENMQVNEGSFTAGGVTLNNGGITAEQGSIAGWLIEADKLSAGNTIIRSSGSLEGNYTQGSSGWILESDGSGEFNDVVIRGQIDAASIGPNGLSIGDGAIQVGSQIEDFNADIEIDGRFHVADSTYFTGSPVNFSSSTNVNIDNRLFAGRIRSNYPGVTQSASKIHTLSDTSPEEGSIYIPIGIVVHDGMTVEMRITQGEHHNEQWVTLNPDYIIDRDGDSEGAYYELLPGRYRFTAGDDLTTARIIEVSRSFGAGTSGGLQLSVNFLE